jgi:hypothetical protein
VTCSKIDLHWLVLSFVENTCVAGPFSPMKIYWKSLGIFPAQVRVLLVLPCWILRGLDQCSVLEILTDWTGPKEPATMSSLGISYQ